MMTYSKKPIKKGNTPRHERRYDIELEEGMNNLLLEEVDDNNKVM